MFRTNAVVRVLGAATSRSMSDLQSAFEKGLGLADRSVRSGLVHWLFSEIGDWKSAGAAHGDCCPIFLVYPSLGAGIRCRFGGCHLSAGAKRGTGRAASCSCRAPTSDVTVGDYFRRYPKWRFANGRAIHEPVKSDFASDGRSLCSYWDNLYSRRHGPAQTTPMHLG